MSKLYMYFPGFRDKAVTFSYDDGVWQDKKLLQIMEKYGLKGTFNISSGLFGNERADPLMNRMTKEAAIELYGHSKIEVAVHGYKHRALVDLERLNITNEILIDKKELESIFGKPIIGMAYAYGAYNDQIVEMLKECGISYARTVIDTEDFKIPEDWLRMPTTCHHNNPRLMELAKEFLAPSDKLNLKIEPKLFYIWGHSYEFDQLDNWEVIENFAQFIGNREDVWYATNGEIFEYVQAYKNLQFNNEESIVYNPSKVDVYFSFLGENYIAYAGEKLNLKEEI